MWWLHDVGDVDGVKGMGAIGIDVAAVMGRGALHGSWLNRDLYNMSEVRNNDKWAYLELPKHTPTVNEVVGRIEIQILAFLGTSTCGHVIVT